MNLKKWAAGWSLLLILAGCSDAQPDKPAAASPVASAPAAERESTAPESPAAETSTSPSASPSASASAEPSETASEDDWDTYSNDRFGFRVQYPSGWQRGVEPDNGDGIKLSDGEEAQVIVSASLYMEETAPDMSSLKEMTLANGNPAKISVTEENGTTSVTMYTIKNDAILCGYFGTFGSDYYRNHRDTIDRMLQNYDFFEGLEG